MTTTQNINNDARCLVIGTGKMGSAHAKVMATLLPGRAAAFAPSARNQDAIEQTGATFLTGTLASAVRDFAPTHAVIASPADTLVDTACLLMDAGIRHILAEKPAALDLATGRRLAEHTARTGSTVWVAYNRRFYTSVLKAKELIKANGESISSVFFEFTESTWPMSGPPNQPAAVMERWVLANGMHVIDGALHPVGLPDNGRSHFMAGGGLPWHPASARFCGAGVTTKNVHFSYISDWGAPGRWGFEWMTSSMRYIFRPMEKLHVMRRGSMAIEEYPLEDELDRTFKPGAYRQGLAFLLGDPEQRMVSLSEALTLIPLAEKIAAYR